MVEILTPVNYFSYGLKITGQAGYDVSNVANIQSRLHEEFGHIELLPWISLSYSLALFSVMFLVRDLTYNFNLRWLYLANLAVFAVGAAVAGSAQTMVAVILGRVTMGVGGAFVQQMQVCGSFLSLHRYANKMSIPQQYVLRFRLCTQG